MRSNNGKGEFYQQVAAGAPEATAVIETGRQFRSVHDIKCISALDDPDAKRGGKAVLAQYSRTSHKVRHHHPTPHPHPPCGSVSQRRAVRWCCRACLL